MSNPFILSLRVLQKKGLIHVLLFLHHTFLSSVVTGKPVNPMRTPPVVNHVLYLALDTTYSRCPRRPHPSYTTAGLFLGLDTISNPNECHAIYGGVVVALTTVSGALLRARIFDADQSGLRQHLAMTICLLVCSIFSI